MRQLVHHDVNRTRCAEQALYDPAYGSCAGKKCAADSQPRVSARAAHEDERRQRRCDHSELHRLDAQVECQNPGQPFPTPQTQLA